MKRAAASFALVLLGSRNAHAAAEGDACAVTVDCSEPLRCVDGRCVSLRPKPHTKTRATFGDGEGYTGAIIGVDIFALAGTTSFLLIAQSIGASYRGGWQAAAMVPVVLGPVVHATRGRWTTAALSFAGWSSLGLTVLASSALSSTCGSCNQSWFIAGASVLVVGGTLLTWLDAWMARDMRETRPAKASWFPVMAPTRSGALAGVGGVF